MKFHPHSVDSVALNRHKEIRPGRHLPTPILCEPSIQTGQRLAFTVPSDNGHVLASPSLLVVLGPSLPVILTLNEVNRKNLVPLEAGCAKNPEIPPPEVLGLLRMTSLDAVIWIPNFA